MSGDEDGDGIRAEARYAALRIRELMSEDNAYYVYDADLEDYRRIKYGDIVILTRTLTGWGRSACAMNCLTAECRLWQILHSSILN